MIKHTLISLCYFLPFMGSALDVSLSPQNAFCGLANGEMQAYVWGGQPPYSYSWSNGQTGPIITGLMPGTYTVTVTDALAEEAIASMAILNDPYPYFEVAMSVAGLQGCNDQCNFGKWVMQSELPPVLVPPYSFDPPLMPPIQGMDPDYLGAITGFCYEPGSMASVTITDANGCTAQLYSPLEWAPSTLPPMNVLSITGACTGSGNGTVMFDVGLPPDPFAVMWDFTILNENMVVVTNWDLGVKAIPGQNITTVGGLLPGNYYIRSLFPNMSQQCVDLHPFTIPDLGSDCGTVGGQLWFDANEDCVKQPGEVGYASTVLIVEPGPQYILTSQDGSFNFALGNGNYTIALVNENVQVGCPGTYPVPFTIANNSATVNIGLTGEGPVDLSISASANPARPGFNHAMYALVQNLYPTLSGPVTVSLAYDPALTHSTILPTPTSVQGNMITWELPPLAGNSTYLVQVNFTIPVNMPLGTVLQSEYTVSNTLPEVTYQNNASAIHTIVTGSYDPNDKLVTTSTGASTTKFYIGEDEWLDYTIRFQNTGTDTAFTVVITDTLAMELDMSSFQQGVASHPFTVSFKPDRVVEWRFENILLPDSNVNEPGSHGLVSFRIKPVEGIQPGGQIINIANIYFDFNPPVITDPSVLIAAMPPVHVKVKAFLSGPYVSGSGNMSDALRSEGLLPLAEPYTALGYAHAGGGGGESTTTEVLARTGGNAIVDWVVIELRNASTSSQVQHTRSALIRRDGQVVDVDGISPVAFSASEGNYHVAIRHRNHLGCMRSTPIALQFTPTSIDLTTNATATWGMDARDNINGAMVLWPGDVNFDGTVKYTGIGNDRDPVLVAIGGTVPTIIVQGVYSNMDVDMNGTMRYTGTSNDRDIILQTIGGTVPTNVRLEQVP